MKATRDLIQKIEALLFVAQEPLSEQTLQRLLGVPLTTLKEVLRSLADDYRERGLQLLCSGGGWIFATNPGCQAVVESYYHPQKKNLSKSALETLAIIAYRQPITRLEIEHIRGVKSEKILSSLLQKDLILEAGRKETLGRPILYETSQKFLLFLGLNDLDELKEFSRAQEMNLFEINDEGEK